MAELHEDGLRAALSRAIKTRMSSSRVGALVAAGGRGGAGRRGTGLAVALLLAGSLAGVAGPPDAAQASADESTYCSTTPGTAKPFYSGASASAVYDKTFATGVPVAHGLINNRYTPQGLTSWASWDGKGEDILLVSAYHDDDADGDEDGPSAVYGMVANGPNAGDSLGRMLIGSGHVGGIAVYNGWLYVGSEFTINAYRLSTVRTALAGANTDTVYKPTVSRTSDFRVGFLGTGDNLLWAGVFSENSDTTLRSYTSSSSTGVLTAGSSSTQVVPKKTQGVAVTSSRVIFSTSYGRNNKSNLWITPRNQTTLTDAKSSCFAAPSMTQGLTVLGSTLHVGFESGAYTYTHPSDNPRNVIKDTHRASLAAVTALYPDGPAR